MGNEAIILAILSIFTPNITTIFTNCCAIKIINEQTRKSVILLFTTILGFVLALLVDAVFSFGLPLSQIFLLGTGTQVVGQFSYRAQKKIEEIRANGNQ